MLQLLETSADVAEQKKKNDSTTQTSCGLFFVRIVGDESFGVVNLSKCENIQARTGEMRCFNFERPEKNKRRLQKIVVSVYKLKQE